MASDIDLGRFISWLDGMARAYGYESDAALARGLGLPQSTISRWRRSTSRPSVEHLVKVSRLFRTDIEPLLTLTGHIPADLQIDPLAAPPSPPPKPITEAERRIRDANIPEDVREALMTYWRRRLDEEHARLYALLGGATVAKSDKDAIEWLARLFETDLSKHVAEAFMSLVLGAAERTRPTSRGKADA